MLLLPLLLERVGGDGDESGEAARARYSVYTQFGCWYATTRLSLPLTVMTGWEVLAPGISKLEGSERLTSH